MKKRSALLNLSIAVAFAVCSVAACDAPVHSPSDRGASDRAAVPGPHTAEPSRDTGPPPPLPAAPGRANASETANASDPPMKAMQPEEESTSMPQPGQANDHSTLANDGKK